MNNQTGYFIVDVEIENNQNRRLQLVMNRENLYLEGFVIRNGNDYNSLGTYYHFSDATHNRLNNQNIQNYINLNFNSNYSGQGGLNDPGTSISWNSIINSFTELLNFNGIENIRRSLVKTILVTSESLIFNNILAFIRNGVYNNWNQYRPILDWNEATNTFLNSININVDGQNYYNINNNRHMQTYINNILLILHHNHWTCN